MAMLTLARYRKLVMTVSILSTPSSIHALAISLYCPPAYASTSLRSKAQRDFILPVRGLFFYRAMQNTYIGEPNVPAFSQIVNALRAFFLEKGFLEVNTQDRLSILAACEDPTTVATFTYAGQVWPLPQTGQMWLEYELLTRPEVAGVFCVSTSYRQEPNPVPGRHRLVFPMFEFEAKGTLDDLRQLEKELAERLGYGSRDAFPSVAYRDAMKRYGTPEISREEERRLAEDHGRVVFLEAFPEHTSPFWNMRRDGNDNACKIDVIIDGMETIGSAERETDVHTMREAFHTISDGQYAQKLFNLFGRDRVEAELESFLALPFFNRFGGGIGLTRLISSLQLSPPLRAIPVQTSSE